MYNYVDCKINYIKETKEGIYFKLIFFEGDYEEGMYIRKAIINTEEYYFPVFDISTINDLIKKQLKNYSPRIPINE